MYIVFGKRILDSKEIKELIEATSRFRVIKDMSKGSKREDILAFNLSIGVDTLKELIAESLDMSTVDEGKFTEDTLFDEYLAAAEEFAAELENKLPKDSILDVMSYKWDKSDNDIKVVIAIAHEELGEVKLRDVMKRLIKQVE